MAISSCFGDKLVRVNHAVWLNNKQCWCYVKYPINRMMKPNRQWKLWSTSTDQLSLWRWGSSPAFLITKLPIHQNPWSSVDSPICQKMHKKLTSTIQSHTYPLSVICRHFWLCMLIPIPLFLLIKACCCIRHYERITMKWCSTMYRGEVVAIGFSFLPLPKK